MNSSVQPSRRGRWVLLALAALILSGFVGSFVLVESGWRPGATRNYGDLRTPAHPIEDVTLADLEGRPVPFSAFKGKWTLVYFGPGECPKPCRDNLYKMRQITAAQGREAFRVQQVFVVTSAEATDGPRHALLADYPDTRVLRDAPGTVRELAVQFAVNGGTPLDGLHRIYVVDPLGNFMMSYAADADPRRMNKDLSLLLRASHIG